MRAEPALILSLAIAVFSFAQQPAPTANQSTSPAQEQKAGDSAAAGAKGTLYVYWVHAGRNRNKPSVYIDEKELTRMKSGYYLDVELDPGRPVLRSTATAAAASLV